MKKVGIIGGAGYTAGELLRLLLNHPEVEIEFIHSTSQAGKKISEIHKDLEGETELTFSDNHPLDKIDILYLCTAHGDSRKFWENNQRPENLRVIDLSQDFRDESEGYVYGLTDENASRIKHAVKIAKPGCFATAIQLSLLPLAHAGLLPKHGDINITALTGSTGAGVKPSETTHFSWRDNNISVYKPFTHQHLKEITMTLRKIDPDFNSRINFIPLRGNFARGIFAVTTLVSTLTKVECLKLYRDFYSDSPFVKVTDSPVNLKQAVNTNKALINIEENQGRLLITCVIDNLLKGASGQAVENMNIMMGFPRETGLRLKPSAF